MNINLALHIWVLCGLFSFRFTASFQDFGNHVDVPYQSQSYNRFVEIEKHCESVISLASELKPYDNRGYRLKNELSFFDGDWEQDNGGSPLMPFYDTDIPQNSSSSVLSPYKLVSFEVNNVDPIRSTKTMIVLSGVLSIGITKDEKVRYDHYQDFYMRSGQSNLGISFEGVYVESEKNGGERLLCLLGNTSALPSFKGVIDPQKTVKEYISNYKNRPPLLQEDQILLVLRYPRIFTFRTRVIHGELKSLREESNLGYFDNVQISSQLGKYSEYQFMTKGYTAYPDHHRSTDDGIKFSAASLFCRSLQMWTSNEVLNIIPNWKCSDKDCSKWPHSIFGSEIWSASRNFDNITLIMQNVKCEEETKESGVSNARVGIVFRLLPSSARKEIEEARTGPGLTLAAEGVWKFSSSELCLLGCLSPVGSGSSRCDSQVRLYFPHQFSITNQSLLSGSISTIVNETTSTLAFERILRYNDFFPNYKYIFSHLTYKYSKIDQARNLVEKSQSAKFVTSLRKSFLSYPKPENGGDLWLLDGLSTELAFRVYAVPDPLPGGQPLRTRIEFAVISLGPLFGPLAYDIYVSLLRKDPSNAQANFTEYQLFNISAILQFTEKPYGNISLLSLEGLYDPILGEMHLVGCRDVRNSPGIMFKSTNLEDGRDCLIEAKVQYPPKTARWLINPTVKISITSQRNKGDPLHFSQINLQTLMITYANHGQDVSFRFAFEGILRVLLLVAMIFLIRRQLSHIRNKDDIAPYISLTMLGIQVFGYILPLLAANAGILFKSKVSEFYKGTSYVLESIPFLGAIYLIAEILYPTALLFTVRLSMEVRRSRIQIMSLKTPGAAKHLNDKKVFVITVFLLIFGFITAHIFRGMNITQMLLEPERFKPSRMNSARRSTWMVETENFVVSLQYFFLLPQIIGNFIWKIEGKSLCKSYYIGFTILRVLIYVYDNIRDPILDPYSLNDGRIIPTRFISKPDMVSVPMVLVLFATVVYIQQRWSYHELKQRMNIWNYKLLLSESKTV